jgi:hypothetical protein
VALAGHAAGRQLHGTQGAGRAPDGQAAGLLGGDGHHPVHHLADAHGDRRQGSDAEALVEQLPVREGLLAAATAAAASAAASAAGSSGGGGSSLSRRREQHQQQQSATAPWLARSPSCCDAATLEGAASSRRLWHNWRAGARLLCIAALLSGTYSTRCFSAATAAVAGGASGLCAFWWTAAAQVPRATPATVLQ